MCKPMWVSRGELSFSNDICANNRLSIGTPKFSTNIATVVESDSSSYIKSDAAPVIKPDAAPVIKPDAAPVIKPDPAPVIEPDAAPVIESDSPSYLTSYKSPEWRLFPR